MGSTPDQFAAAIREDFARWAKVVRAANIRAE
jgi:tripartite-type tricarboxylate transporter receptor subunit TctC